MSTTISLTTIATVHSPFKEKFAIPRQPGIVTAAKGKVILSGEFNHPDYIRELQQFSHIWLLFIFHAIQNKGARPLVRPPRLGGNKKVGVFATRSTFRPNPIGMSVVKLDDITIENKQVILHISGLDLLDQTPIVDIKPYIPYSDALVNAQAGFASNPPAKNLMITFSLQAKQTLANEKTLIPELENLIVQVLSQDPRPAYKQNKVDNKIYGMSLYDLNIQWKMKGLDDIEVILITKNKDTHEP